MWWRKKASAWVPPKMPTSWSTIHGQSNALRHFVFEEIPYGAVPIYYMEGAGLIVTQGAEIGDVSRSVRRAITPMITEDRWWWNHRAEEMLLRAARQHEPVTEGDIGRWFATRNMGLHDIMRIGNDLVAVAPPEYVGRFVAQGEDCGLLMTNVDTACIVRMHHL